MKVNSLEINEFRGIRHLEIAFSGKNVSIYGPNGSGKSGVVDALDFLLTGQISRLTGEGTSGISLKEHGKHIDADLNEAFVSGYLHFDGFEEEVEVKRFVRKSTELIYDEKYQDIIEPILQLAGRGHYVLTRKNLLKYIVAKSGDRGKEIQTLLNIDEIEHVRTELMKNQNLQEKNLKFAKTTLKNSEAELADLCDLRIFSMDSVLEKINQTRVVLDGTPITKLLATNVVDGIALPESSSGKTAINTTTLLVDCQDLIDFISPDSQDKLRSSLESYLLSAEIFLSDPKFRRLLNLENIVKNGIELLDDSGSCPLCDTAWLPGELRKFLTEKQIRAQESCIQYDAVKIKSDSISKILMNLSSLIKRFLDKSTLLPADKMITEGFQKWRERIERTINVLTNPFEQHNLIELKIVVDLSWIIPEYLPELLENTKELIESKKNEKTPELIAWEFLTKLSVQVSRWEKAEATLSYQQIIFYRAQQIYTAYIDSRDAVLKRLFDSITDRFISLYRAMHGDDEKGFSADISFKGSGIDFTVDFYGRGKIPPQALHSEGHQDSMGICLYLALAEALTEGVFNLIVLDDVVMSVDAEHRRQFSKMLSSEFPNIQFVITTHDRIWATQLRNDGVISRLNSLEFNNWTLELGPSVYNEDTENWDYINKLINSNKIPLASATLRRSSEQFLAAVCENLEGQVVYKSNNQRELGELGSAVVSRYKKLLKQSWSAYHSWGDMDKAEKVKLLEKEFDNVCAVKEVEEWVINPSTHFNDWASFSSDDFSPIVDAFKCFFDSFKCPDCGSIIKLTKQKNKDTSLCCKCKKINLNLECKEKSDKLPVADINT